MVSSETRVLNDLRGLKVVLRHWREGVGKELLPQLADRIRDQTRLRIATTKRGPTGRKWKKRKDKKRHGLLTKSRKLLRSIRVQRINRNEMQVGSALDRALWHQDGTRNMTGRPFMGLNGKNEKELKDHIDLWVMKFGSRTRSLARELR
jgi:phage gpG-like protein